MDLIPTPSQTVGPYFHLGLTSKNSIACITKARTSEESVWLTCCVFDGDGVPVNDAMIEMWQADGAGEYPRAEDLGGSANEPAFQGFGRLASDENGICTFETTKPGRVPGPDGALQAPHINVSVFARGLLNRLATRIYFAGDPANSEDPILPLVPAERRDTLMAHPDPARVGGWRFDIHLRGERETVFFDV